MEDMEIENDTQVDVCRLCDCESDENGEMFSIFDKNEDGQEIISFIQECLPLVIYKTDPLSKYICGECLEKLNNLYKFKEKTVKVADKQREKLLSNGNLENEDIQIYLSYDDDNVIRNGQVVDPHNVISKETTDEVLNENNDFKSKEDSNELEKENDEEDKITIDRVPKENTNDIMKITINSVSKINEKIMRKNEATTSTDDLTVLCSNCRSEILEAHKIDNEIELCSELHDAIADSFQRNKIVISDKFLRSRRKRNQGFYHELEDSLCSSLTEFTNTESSQCFEFQSDVESTGEEEDERSAKRRRIEVKEIIVPSICYEEHFADEIEYKYNPLKLLQLCLNVINKENIPEYEPDDYIETLVQPECSYCGINYKNSKLLALHETTHMSIELGEKVDNPILWHESRDDSFIRNKWLTSEDDIIVEEETELETEMMDVDAMEVEPEEEEEEESLLIPVGSSEQRDGSFETTREIILNDGKPYVDGLPLSDYAKEERRAFYHSMRIGGVNKRFCTLCRYSFKDNWAIESHYFSMACYYTCRYCGMRFNKQRNRFDEHIEGHVRNGDQYSNKVFAASKNNNIVPKVLYPKKRQSGADSVDAMMIAAPASVKNLLLQQKQFSENRTKQDTNYQRQAQLPKLQSQQNQPQLQTSQSKTGNQAYFCRKCYKVFFKLDEFSIHSKNCDFNQFPNNTMLGNYLTSGSKTNGEPAQSNSGRPIRNCAKDTGPYRDEVYIPEHILKDQLPNTGPPPGPYICYVCNTPFPTIYSRNSHMRIHKAENLPPSTSQPPQQTFKSSGGYQDSNQYSTNVAYLAHVKQEPLDLEPEVEIHEAGSQENFSTNLGPAVSITPIQKNPNQKLQIDPNVMKLVQNNPQLSIKNREPQQQNNQQYQQFQQMLGGQDADRTYKCSSCWEAFANKSHLYFHKKNQCEGSKYPCPFCKKRFGTEAAYSSHIFYSHPE